METSLRLLARPSSDSETLLPAWAHIPGRRCRVVHDLGGSGAPRAASPRRAGRRGRDAASRRFIARPRPRSGSRDSSARTSPGAPARTKLLRRHTTLVRVASSKNASTCPQSYPFERNRPSRTRPSLLPYSGSPERRMSSTGASACRNRRSLGGQSHRWHQESPRAER